MGEGKRVRFSACFLHPPRRRVLGLFSPSFLSCDPLFKGCVEVKMAIFTPKPLNHSEIGCFRRMVKPSHARCSFSVRYGRKVTRWRQKNENSLMCAYTRAPVRKWSGRLTETRLVCSDSSHVLRDTGRLLRKLCWSGDWGCWSLVLFAPHSKNFLYYRVEVGDFSIPKFCD